MRTTLFAHLRPLDPVGWAEAAVAEVLGYKDLLLEHRHRPLQPLLAEKVRRSYSKGLGRGQGWALLGLIDVADYLPDGQTGAKPSSRRPASRRMLDYQLADGNWHCMVHEEFRPPPKVRQQPSWQPPLLRGMTLNTPRRRIREPNGLSARWSGVFDQDGNLLGVSAAVMSALVQEHY